LRFEPRPLLRSGDFATENGLHIGHGRSFVPAYQNGALVLTVSR